MNNAQTLEGLAVPPWEWPWWRMRKHDALVLPWFVLIHVTALVGLILLPLPGWRVLLGSFCLVWMGGMAFLDGAGRFLIVEVKVKPEELDKAVGQLRRHARLYVETFHIEAARLRLAVACPYIPPPESPSLQKSGLCASRSRGICPARFKTGSAIMLTVVEAEG